MLKKIIEQLKTSEATCWKIEENIVESREFFFIKDRSDIGRSKKVKHIDVTVYRDFSGEDEKYRGSASVSLSPMMSEAELKESIEGAVFAAGFVKNKWYPITEPYTKAFESDDKDLEELSSGAVKAIFDANKIPNAWLNSVELFISHITSHLLNSEGLDVSFSKYKTYIETIVSATGKEEVELYDQFQLSLPDSEQIRNRISGLLQMVSERANATPTPSLKEVPVILTGEPTKEFMRYYLHQANAHQKYDKLSQAEINSSVQGKEKGDRITLEIAAQLEGSAFNTPVDDDGFIITSERIIEDGILKSFWGDLRYSHYLGIKPTGSAQNFKVSGGSVTTEEMREKPHLEVTHFSAVDMDDTTGDFGGEIRLGWYFDGTKRIPVTGGSVTGNLKDLLSIKLSSDTQLEEDYFGPHSICVEGFRISGE